MPEYAADGLAVAIVAAVLPIFDLELEFDAGELNDPAAFKPVKATPLVVPVRPSAGAETVVPRVAWARKFPEEPKRPFVRRRLPDVLRPIPTPALMELERSMLGAVRREGL